MSGRQKDYHTLREELNRTNSLFVDAEFPPENSSLTFNRTLPSGLRNVIWKRPTELSRNPKFIVRNATRFDLDQGYLGNCWFIAGAALVATKKKLLERVVPQDQDFDRNYAGVFHFNFWWYGKWVEVIIDDYLPTDGYRLIYGKNREEPNEFWAALLEKAYAKLRGCYEATDGGKLQDSVVDLTGGISETIDIKDKTQIPVDIYEILWRSWKMNSFLGCSISLPANVVATSREVRRPNGLYMGHAYSITALAVIPYQGSSVRLCRLRNPWGRSEWNGDWSDESYQIRNLSSEAKQRLGIVIQDEGEFWIPIDDVLVNFEEIQLVHLQPDATTQGVALEERKRQWNVTVYHDQWIKGVTAGGCGNSPYQDLYWKNPQFSVTLRDVDDTDNKPTCTVIISLIEKEHNNKSNIAIGFDVYKLKYPQNRPLDGETAPRNALILKKRSGVYQYNREVTRRFDLTPGTYVIIPSSFRPHEEAEFMLRIYTEKIINSLVLDESNGEVKPEPKPPPVRDPFRDLFLKHAGEDGKLKAKELKEFILDLSRTEINEPLKFSTETCRSLITMMDRNKSGAMNYEESVKMWKEVKSYRSVFQQFDVDGSGTVDTYELDKLFSTLGFPVNRMVQTAIVRRYADRNSKIRLTDFIIVICKLTLMYQIFKDQQIKSGNPDSASFSMNEFLYYTMYC
ncbi:calpain-9-like isoform X1 [Ostrea edulis]|uniref:calpain-9-like isoform X1 n=1 Tax=Ostrea edulis TaxID=37623 RepID=UPI002095335D|nr:calpain-9-like isoform X1 [Ostrea edulis]